MKFARLLLLTWLTSSNFYILTNARVEMKFKGIYNHRETQTEAKQENWRNKRAVNNIPWSDVDLVESKDPAFLSLNTTFGAATGGLGKTGRRRNWRGVKCAKRKLPLTCATNMYCSTVKCNLLFARKKGSVTFNANNCQLTAKIQVPSLKINWSHTFTSKKQPPVLIPPFSYNVGVMQGGVFLKARLWHRKGAKRFNAKVRVLVGGRIPKVSTYLIGTKLLQLSFLTKGKKCGKMPGSTTRPSSSKGPCANMKFPKICKISSDCLRISCGVGFAGQKVSLNFGINKCDNPVSLLAGIKVTALKINFKQKIKGGAMIPIPGFGVNVGAMKAGVFVRVGLNTKGGKFALQIKLMAGASVPFVGKVYPLKITVLNVKLPIKVKGCAQATELIDAPNPSQISSLSQIQLQPNDSSTDDQMDPSEEPSRYGGHSWKSSNADGRTANNRDFYEYQEMDPDNPIVIGPSTKGPYGASDATDVIKGSPLARTSSNDIWPIEEANQQRRRK